MPRYALCLSSVSVSVSILIIKKKCARRARAPTDPQSRSSRWSTQRHRSMVSAGPGRPGGFGLAAGAAGGAFPSSSSSSSSSSMSSFSSPSVATAWNPALTAARLPVGRMDRVPFRPGTEAPTARSAPPCRFFRASAQPCMNIAAREWAHTHARARDQSALRGRSATGRVGRGRRHGVTA